MLCSAQEKLHDRWSQEKSNLSLWLEKLQNSEQSGKDVVDSLIRHKNYFSSVFTTFASSFCLIEDLHWQKWTATCGKCKRLLLRLLWKLWRYFGEISSFSRGVYFKLKAMLWESFYELHHYNFAHLLKRKYTSRFVEVNNTEARKGHPQS